MMFYRLLTLCLICVPQSQLLKSLQICQFKNYVSGSVEQISILIIMLMCLNQHRAVMDECLKPSCI